MTTLSNKARIEWAFFIGKDGRRKYNKLCKQCIADCKQSDQAVIASCPKYKRKP